MRLFGLDPFSAVAFLATVVAAVIETVARAFVFAASTLHVAIGRMAEMAAERAAVVVFPAFHSKRIIACRG